jgi:hypothetical protein
LYKRIIFNRFAGMEIECRYFWTEQKVVRKKAVKERLNDLVDAINNLSETERKFKRGNLDYDLRYQHKQTGYIVEPQNMMQEILHPFSRIYKAKMEDFEKIYINKQI